MKIRARNIGEILRNSLKSSFTLSAFPKVSYTFVILFTVCQSLNSSAQLGVYQFTGTGACPHQNTNVTAQPANAVFSSFSTTGANCVSVDDEYRFDNWNENSSINTGEYHGFSLTADAGYMLNLSSLNFVHRASENGSGSGSGNTTWILRSSVDGFASNVATGSVNENTQTGSVSFSAAFNNITTVTFRLYLVETKDDETYWTIDDVTVDGSVSVFVPLPVTPPNPTSNSPQCANPGVTITANGSAPAGETWYWQTSATGTSTANSNATYVVATSGTYYIRSQNNTTLAWSTGAGSVTVTVTPDVTVPVFAAGATSSRCQANGNVVYGATAANTTGITYSLDATTLAAGVTINPATGLVDYTPGWNGTTIITASAAGCNGPQTATHTVTVYPPVDVPVFAAGTSSTRCAGASSITYTATAAGATNITYSLDLLSVVGGNTINAATGQVNFSALWVGATTITAVASGPCGPNRQATHVVNITGNVGNPSFLMGGNSTRCQNANTITYTATAANTSGITYTLDAASLAGGNTINASTGAVTFDGAWTGTSVITASAAGCAGPRTVNHTVTTTPSVSTPVFASGASSTRCQGISTVTYSAAAANTTGITYSLDAVSAAAGNSINTSTGAVTFTSGWNGTTVITASAAGCNGPATANHTVSITPTVGLPVFDMGTTSVRCQGTGTQTYTATSTNSTGMTYSLNAASLAAGNTINASTGLVTYVAGYSGTTIITASATGCNGPRTSTHTVTVNATVAAPVFAMGIVSSRTQGAGTETYTATAANSTGITYSLDAASLAAGNTINAATGEVNYVATWNGTSVITATAAGCNGPATSTHTVTINGTTVYKQLYLSDPSQALDRVDPVNTADATTANTALLSSAGTTNTTFTMNPVLCDSLRIKAGIITVRTYVTVSSGTMPATPAVTALLQYGSTTIISLTNPSFSGGMLTWTGTLASDVLIPAGQAISLRVTTAQAGVIFRIDFDSQTKPSRIDIPVSTFINITSLNVFSAAYPGGMVVTNGVAGSTKYIRATVTDPFGSNDITGLGITLTPPGTTVSATSVATSGCTRTYEYPWTTPSTGGVIAIKAIAREGYENTVTNTRNTNYSICTTCPPAALNDSVTGAGGTPIAVSVLANDSDPNNNLNPASLTIVGQPKNGSAYISNNAIIYLPNGTFSGKDTITYQICDLTSPTPLCATAQVFYVIDPLVVDVCADAAKTHTYYIPYPEQQAYTALEASGSPAMPSNNIRTVISIKVPYPGMRIVWDEWEDGYEATTLNPVQNSTKVWGDGNPFNGIAPGYSSDIIPAGGSIILDNTMPANPRNAANFFYDGKDKIVSSGQVALTQVCGEPSIMSVQSIKTNVTSTYDFGQSFTIPLGQDFPSRDFRYTALFLRAAENNTTINIDKDNDGVFETTTVLNEGNSYLINGGVLTGATIASDKPIGVELNAGGVDNYSIRNAPIFPATWYGHTYYTPVPTSDNSTDNPKDSSVVMLYNSLNRDITINWYYGGSPSSGAIVVPAKSARRFPLAYSTTSTYKFVNPTGESFTAIEMVNSYAPGTTGTSGSAYDWSFNLISEQRLTDYTTVAWAPGGLDLTGNSNPDVNGNPIWVTPTANTTLYVKYDGDVNGTSGSVSPCGLRYDDAINVNALNYVKIRDNSDNDQGGIAIYTCNGAKIAAVYGEDPQGSTAGNSAYWDVGTTIQPFCKQKLVIATDDYATTLVSQPVTISVLNNDFGFLATINPSSVSTIGLTQPSHGTLHINLNGTILYTPQPGFSGIDTFEYTVCSTPSPIVCDIAMVVIRISTCPSNGNQNVISGQVFADRNKDAVNNDGGAGIAGVKVYLYTDGDCDLVIDPNELTDSVTVDSSGFYQFMKYPEKTAEDNFDNTSGGRTCENGSDGDTNWGSNWIESNDGSTGLCNTASTNNDVEITRDGAFGYALRLKDNDRSVRRSVNLNGATKAFLTFSYRRKSTGFTSSEQVYVQASTNGSTYNTIYTITGDGVVDAGYTTIYNQDISGYANSNTTIRFLTSDDMEDSDSVYIDNVTIRFLKYPQCYITAVAASSVPAGYTVTTPTSKTTTITAGGTCTSQFDFGYSKQNITISGTLRVDNNGLIDGNVNGPGIGSPSGSTVYAYLADATGKVALKTTVSSSNGSYSFPLAEVSTTYTLRVSTTSVALGDSMPNGCSFNNVWMVVGDAYGTNNAAGSGAEAGTPNGCVTVTTGTVNVNNVDFGIERLPNSDDYTRSITHPTMNQMITLNGAGINPPVLSGSDPEDCTSGCVLTGRRVIIDTVPANAELYYNGIFLVNGQMLTNFNPSLLQLKITAATMGTNTVSFRYSYVDAANMKDPSSATYTLAWFIPLPADALVAKATLKDNETTISWSTQSESNTSHFTVERSLDNEHFTSIGNDVAAAGNSTTQSDYQAVDNVSGLLQNPVLYYRVKLTDIDGKIKYSNVVAVKLATAVNVQAWPNPFRSNVTVSITTERPTVFQIQLVDMGGKTMMNFSKSVSKGVSQISLPDLSKLPNGMYMLVVTDQNTSVRTAQKLIKN